MACPINGWKRLENTYKRRWENAGAHCAICYEGGPCEIGQKIQHDAWVKQNSMCYDCYEGRDCKYCK